MATVMAAPHLRCLVGASSRSAARDPVEGSSSTDLFLIELAEEFEREAEALENSKEEDTN